MPELSTITDPNLPEPKGVSTAAANQVYISDGEGGGVWTTVNNSGYVDIQSTDAPQTLVANTWTTLDNNGLGPATQIDQLPNGVVNPWDPTNSRILFSGTGMDVGDEFSVRIDVNFTTTANSDEVRLRMLFASGDVSQFDLPVMDRLVKNSGDYREPINAMFYIGYPFVRDNPIEIQAWTDGTGNSVDVQGWYISLSPRTIRSF